MLEQSKQKGVLAAELLGKLASCKAQGVEVDRETFIQSTVGPDAVELTPSYRDPDWAIAIHDTDQDGTILFAKDDTGVYPTVHHEDIANHELFLLARSLSPLTKLDGSSA